MTIPQSASLIVLSAFALAAQAQLKPWPGDQPPVIQPVVNPAGQPAVYQPQQPQKSSGGGSGGGQAQQMIQQMMGAMGGDREIASGGEDSSGVGFGNQNALDFSGSKKSVGGEPQKLVNGCTTDPMKVRLVYSEKTLSSGCDKAIQMSETLADTIDTHFMRCTRQSAAATGMHINGAMENVKIHHKGCKGDKNHETTGSYHNLSMALDVRAIEVGGTVFDVSNNAYDPFFAEFRKCWAEAVNGLRGGCLTNKHPGSVGDEDAEHRNSHLHLSVPYCPQVARAKGMYIAQFLQWFLGEMAHAAEKKNRPVTTYKGKTVVLKNGAAVKLVVGDLGGEPVGADQRMTLSLKCKGEKEFRKLDEYSEGCRYDGLDIDEDRGFATIRFTGSQMNDEGVLECTVPRTKILNISCK